LGGFLELTDFQGKKGRQVKADKRKEWDLAKQVWGGGEDIDTPSKVKKKKQPTRVSENDKENTPGGSRRSGRTASRVNYLELSGESKSIGESKSM